MANHCKYCEREFVEYTTGNNQDLRKTRDHVISLALGGSNRQKNIVFACVQCNTAKGGLSLEDFISKLDKLINSKNKCAYRSAHEKLYPVIRANVEKLILKIKPYRHELLKGFRHHTRSQVITHKNKPINQVTVHVSTPQQPAKEKRYPEKGYIETVDQFNARRDREARIKELLSGPEPNFHEE